MYQEITIILVVIITLVACVVGLSDLYYAAVRFVKDDKETTNKKGDYVGRYTFFGNILYKIYICYTPSPSLPTKRGDHYWTLLICWMFGLIASFIWPISFLILAIYGFLLLLRKLNRVKKEIDALRKKASSASEKNESPENAVVLSFEKSLNLQVRGIEIRSTFYWSKGKATLSSKRSISGVPAPTVEEMWEILLPAGFVKYTEGGRKQWSVWYKHLCIAATNINELEVVYAGLLWAQEKGLI